MLHVTGGGRELLQRECEELKVAVLACGCWKDQARTQRGVGNQQGSVESHQLVCLKDEIQLGGRCADLPAKA